MTRSATDQKPRFSVVLIRRRRGQLLAIGQTDNPDVVKATRRAVLAELSSPSSRNPQKPTEGPPG